MNTTTSTPTPPVALTAYDCWGLLEDEEIARIAWAGPDGVAIVPVNYTVSDGALWFRTQPYTTLARRCTHGTVTLEVDHLDRRTRAAWSVVVTGTAERVPVQDVPDHLVGMEIWPAGPASLFIRVTPHEVTGRRLWGRSAARDAEEGE
ncbi:MULTISPECIES: pyridoxamine 5'-phosphate oxidase family protein [unclassified Nocardioides]|uniref:pyridoxamine 5'-phosphate oxidase family protein n=1 Tax=unclassified Nocardioides TaxID=2615069 RepID=UPI00360949E8